MFIVGIIMIIICLLILFYFLTVCMRMFYSIISMNKDVYIKS